MHRVALTAAVLVAAALASAPLAGQPDGPAVPVHQEPRHHLVFETPGTRILDVQVPPGDTTLFHTHTDPVLYVTMSASRTRSQTLVAEWTRGDASQPPPAAGGPPPRPALGRLMSTTSYARQPLTHRVNNIGSTLFRLIGITNASPGDAGATPGAGFDTAPELTNPWFRGYRHALGAAAPEHRHDNPVAAVLISGRATVPGGAPTTLDVPGAFAWIDAGTLHRLQAVGGAAEVVEVEVRRPR